MPFFIFLFILLGSACGSKITTMKRNNDLKQYHKHCEKIGLCPEPLLKEIETSVFYTNSDEFKEICDELRLFLRDEPHKMQGYVGMCNRLQEASRNLDSLYCYKKGCENLNLTQFQEKQSIQIHNRVVTILCNKHGYLSKPQAYRIAARAFLMSPDYDYSAFN